MVAPRPAKAGTRPAESSMLLAPEPASSEPNEQSFAMAAGADSVRLAATGGTVSHASIEPLPAAPAASPAAQDAPEVTVTIGTIELRAAPAAPPAPTPVPAATPERRGPRLSLDEYLQRRGKGRP